MVNIGITAISGEKLGASVDLIAHRRNIVVVTTCTEEACILPTGYVLGKNTVHMALEIMLRQKGLRQIQRAIHADLLRNERINLLDRVDAEAIEHLTLYTFVAIWDIRILNAHSSASLNQLARQPCNKRRTNPTDDQRKNLQSYKR